MLLSARMRVLNIHTTDGIWCIYSKRITNNIFDFLDLMPSLLLWFGWIFMCFFWLEIVWKLPGWVLFSTNHFPRVSFFEGERKYGSNCREIVHLCHSVRPLICFFSSHCCHFTYRWLIIIRIRRMWKWPKGSKSFLGSFAWKTTSCHHSNSNSFQFWKKA